MADTWFNKDGLVVRFGGYHSERPKLVNQARFLNSLGAVKTLEIDYDLTKIADGDTGFSTDRDNDGDVDGFTKGDVAIPAQAVIESCVIYVDEAAAGGTSVTVGTFELDGTPIDADGLVTAANGATANIDAAGDRQAGSGADIGTTHSAAEDGYLALTVDGTFTAGKGRIVIKYVDTDSDR